MARVLLIGATSAMAEAFARLCAERTDRIFLLGRNRGRLEAVAADLRVRGAAEVLVEAADLADTRLHGEILGRAFQAFGGFETVLLAYGVLPDQKECEADAGKACEAIDVNFTSAVSWLTHLANRMERGGVLAAISSVAGDRGRPSNYVYGAAKGGLTVFLEGLRARLHRSGVTVVTVKPGFVDTPMTADVRKNFLFVSPERAARGIFRAIERKRDVAYVPGFWRWIMLAIVHVPGRLFKRLSL